MPSQKLNDIKREFKFFFETSLSIYEIGIDKDTENETHQKNSTHVKQQQLIWLL